MKNEDRVIELLSELLVRPDKFEVGLNKLELGLDKLAAGLGILASLQERLITIQERQDKILINILGVLADDVPKFDELIEMDSWKAEKGDPQEIQIVE